jgi:hypothetical protein
MKVVIIERSLMLAAAIGMLSAAARWHGATSTTVVAPPPAAPTRTAAPMPSDSALAEAEDLTVSNDPFRLSNTPPDVRFDPAAENGSGARGFAPPPVRPAFVLKAIVGGPPWQAVIDGIPGQPAGTVIRQGAQYDKLVVRSVTRDSVIIAGPDTSWVLRFGRRP